jgi:hypothetical protein
MENKLELFIDSVFLAPLEYGRGLHYSVIDKLKLTWWVIALGLFISFLSMKASSEKNKNITYILVTFLLGTLYTFFSSGIVNGHYMIQVYPFILMLLLGIIIQKDFRLYLGLTAIFVLLISIESIAEYYALITNYRQNATFYYRQSFTIVNELKKKSLDNKKIFFADYHIGYWLLGHYPLLKSTTHPSNLARPFLFKYFDNKRNTSIDELKYLMEEIKPDVVVSKAEQLGFFMDSTKEDIYYKTILAKEFKVIYQDNDSKIFIWQRLEN